MQNSIFKRLDSKDPVVAGESSNRKGWLDSLRGGNRVEKEGKKRNSRRLAYSGAGPRRSITEADRQQLTRGSLLTGRWRPFPWITEGTCLENRLRIRAGRDNAKRQKIEAVETTAEQDRELGRMVRNTGEGTRNEFSDVHSPTEEPS